MNADLAVEGFVGALHGDGSIDDSFGFGTGYVRLDLARFANDEFEREGRVLAVAELPDRSILLAGYIERLRRDEPRRWVTNAILARVRFDGSLDPSFGTSGVILIDADDSLFSSVVVMPGGHGVAGGYSGREALLARF
jgi:hypothetical protein